MLVNLFVINGCLWFINNKDNIFFRVGDKWILEKKIVFKKKNVCIKLIVIRYDLSILRINGWFDLVNVVWFW